LQRIIARAKQQSSYLSLLDEKAVLMGARFFVLVTSLPFYQLRPVPIVFCPAPADLDLSLLSCDNGFNSNQGGINMGEKPANARLAIYTPQLLINGYVKLKARKIRDKVTYSKRISDALNNASERMAQAGEPNFIELKNVEIQDLRTNQVIKGIRSAVINKSAITVIIPGGHLTQNEDIVSC
jgi:hypothetical protein